MIIDDFVKSRVAQCYWQNDFNCATTSLKILSEYFSIDLNSQIFDSALGMHGAGKYGAQCGLVEGPLLFTGILGRSLKMDDESIIKACNDFAGAFEKRFGSLQCSILRPQGFSPENPPHICEPITV